MNNPIINALLKYNLRLMERKLPLAIPMGKEPRIPEFLLPFYYGQKGSSEILSEYRKYKVSINLGFTQLPSREIFESLACGTPVISAYSDAIGDIFGDAVYYTESEKETANQVALLFSNETEWERASVKGIRKVFSEHTYCERFNSLGKAYNLKLKPAGSLKPRVVILSAINNFNELESLANNILRQSFKPSGVILFSKESGSNFELNGGIKSAFGDIKYYFVQFGRNQEYSKLVERIDAEYFAVCGPSDYYGVEYLNDFILATKYHNGGVFFGRASYYEFSGNGIKVNHPGQQFSFVSEVPNGSLFFHKSFLQSFNPNSLMKRDYTFKTFGSNILSVDSMNYIKSAEEFPVPDKFFSLVKA